MSAVVGWVMVAEAVAVHPPASVTVTVYVPAVNEVADDVVFESLHL